MMKLFSLIVAILFVIFSYSSLYGATVTRGADGVDGPGSACYLDNSDNEVLYSQGRDVTLITSSGTVAFKGGDILDISADTGGGPILVSIANGGYFSGTATDTTTSTLTSTSTSTAVATATFTATGTASGSILSTGSLTRTTTGSTTESGSATYTVTNVGITTIGTSSSTGSGAIQIGAVVTFTMTTTGTVDITGTGTSTTTDTGTSTVSGQGTGTVAGTATVTGTFYTTGFVNATYTLSNTRTSTATTTGTSSITQVFTGTITTTGSGTATFSGYSLSATGTGSGTGTQTHTWHPTGTYTSTTTSTRTATATTTDLRYPTTVFAGSTSTYTFSGRGLVTGVNNGLVTGASTMVSSDVTSALNYTPVPNTNTVNGKQLSTNPVLAALDVGACYSNMGCSTGQFQTGCNSVGHPTCASVSAGDVGACYSNMGCSTGQFQTGCDSSGHPTCASISAGDVGACYANMGCSAGQFQTGCDSFGHPKCASLVWTGYARGPAGGAVALSGGASVTLAYYSFIAPSTGATSTVSLVGTSSTAFNGGMGSTSGSPSICYLGFFLDGTSAGYAVCDGTTNSASAQPGGIVTLPVNCAITVASGSSHTVYFQLSADASGGTCTVPSYGAHITATGTP